MAIRFFVDNFIRRFESTYQPLNQIEIFQSVILNNFDTFVKQNQNSKVWPVLKSNAYGHGLIQLVNILRHRQFDYYLVDSYLEALKIWSVDRHPVLLLSSIHPSNLKNIDFSLLALTIQDIPSLEVLSSLNRPVKIHLKINTGLNRQGIDQPELPEIIAILKKNPQIILEGIYSHLADADNPTDTYSSQQLKIFIQYLKLISSSGLEPRFIHLAATYGTPKINYSKINAIRLGLGLYGYGPISGLTPALRFTSTITKLRTIQKGDKVSYNCTYTAKNSTNIAIIPVGYFEGLDRRLSNCGFIKYKNNFYPIIGRVCMNLAIVNLGNTKANLFDSVEVVSPKNTGNNSVSTIASLCQTIPYDILVHFNESIRRTIV